MVPRLRSGVPLRSGGRSGRLSRNGFGIPSSAGGSRRAAPPATAARFETIAGTGARFVHGSYPEGDGLFAEAAAVEEGLKARLGGSAERRPTDEVATT